MIRFRDDNFRFYYYFPNLMTKLLPKLFLTKTSSWWCVRAAANLIGLSSEVSDRDYVLIGGTETSDPMKALRIIARGSLDHKLFGSNEVDAAQIEQYLDYSASMVGNDYKTLIGKIMHLNERLIFRTFMCSHIISIADLALFDSLHSSLIWAKISKGTEYFNLSRWYNYIKSLELVKDATNSKRQQSKEDQGSFDIGLDGAVQGSVVTRFPPEPSGYLHIGHAKAALLNEYFARAYGGKLILRFDDTNPSKEKSEFEESIIEDLKLLQINADIKTYTSDYFQLLHDYCIKMINSGNAYVDDTPQEVMRAERMDGIASKNRNLSVKENLEKFEQMKMATEVGLLHCVRAKMSVDAKNKALRDPVIYRCNLLPHHRTGTKWKVYPTYDFACPIVDSIEGVTHALRTNEYHDRNDQYYWFIEKLGIRKPIIWDYSRVNFVYTLLSKRKLQWFVDNKYVTGWDDPRFPTVRGILRRGMTVQALKKYILSQGASKNVLSLEWDKIWTLNKQIIDPVAPRYTVVQNKRMVELVNVNECISREIPRHKKNESLGNKTVKYGPRIFIDEADAIDLKDGEEVTLMDWGNCIFTKCSNNVLEANLHLEGDFKKTKKKLTWICESPDVVPVDLVDYDYLIVKVFIYLFNSRKNSRTGILLRIVSTKQLFSLLL
jgi:glutamyl-tRNA synthetase